MRSCFLVKNLEAETCMTVMAIRRSVAKVESDKSFPPQTQMFRHVDTYSERTSRQDNTGNAILLPNYR